MNVTKKISIPDYELYFSFARSSGPGGQNVNKVESKAILWWNVEATPSLPTKVKVRFLTRYQKTISKDGLLKISSNRFRDQPRNKADCLEKLKNMILSVVPEPKIRKPTKPTRASQERRVRSKKIRADKKKMRRAVGHSD